MTRLYVATPKKSFSVQLFNINVVKMNILTRLIFQAIDLNENKISEIEQRSFASFNQLGNSTFKKQSNSFN